MLPHDFMFRFGNLNVRSVLAEIEKTDAEDAARGGGVWTEVYDSPFMLGPKCRNELLIRFRVTN